MAKYALLVGINSYPSSPLNGCINDVLDLRERLIQVYGFKQNLIRCLFDRRATKFAILSGLQWLISRGGPGDDLVFQFSGHGSQVPDLNGDEIDKLDEILCPYDYDLQWNTPLSDDVLAQLFKPLVKGAHLTVILDSCHSGTGTREIKATGETRSRYISPPLDLTLSSNGTEPIRRLGVKMRKTTLGLSIDPTMRHVLLAGCRSNQTSSDAIIGGRPNGAFTRCLLDSLTELGHTWVDVIERTNKLLSERHFAQEAQLEGSQALVNGYPFV